MKKTPSHTHTHTLARTNDARAPSLLYSHSYNTNADFVMASHRTIFARSQPVSIRIVRIRIHRMHSI